MNDPNSMSKGLQADEFEEQLKRSLRPVEAPEGFAARVLDRAGASERAVPLQRRIWHRPRLGWFGAVAAILLLAVLVANQVRARRERARAAAIQAQFDTAMRVTAGALEQTRLELERVGVKLGE